MVKVLFRRPCHVPPCLINGEGGSISDEACTCMCVLSLFRLPGEAVARGGYVRLCGANKVDSKVFSRAILARVHTVSHLFFF
jgi:hypothetical protein